MNLISKAIDQLQPSKPVFQIIQDRGWDDKSRVYLNKMSNHYSGKCETPIEKLVSQNYGESFNNDKKSYVINVDSIVESCKREIKESIVKFLNQNMPQKFPMETKMGLFYRDKMFARDVPAFDNAVVSTYNFYMDKKDIQNTMKLLEFLFIKHRNEFPEEINKKKRKRRRR
jgi:hypothetical protein